ncbi:hypothetical protein D3C73_1156710 [compost metagenome]
MQGERPPDVLGVGRRDRVFLELEPGGGHVLEGVFRFCALGLIQRIALHLRIDALGEQLACFDRHLSGVRQRELWVGAQAHVDAVLGHRFTVIEIPQQRAVAAYTELQTVTVGEDVILGRGFDSLELSIR